MPNSKQTPRNEIEIRLRKVRGKDARFLWELSNDLEVRAASFSSAPIVWEEHIKWFDSKTNDSFCVFYIVLNGKNIRIGQVRFDLSNKEAVISASLRKESRGCGYGTTMIKLSSMKLFDSSNARRIHAYIKPANTQSLKAFSRATFKDVGTIDICGNEARHLVLDRGGVYAKHNRN